MNMLPNKQATGERVQTRRFSLRHNPTPLLVILGLGLATQTGLTQIANEDSFYYRRDAGGFPVSELSKFQFYGNAARLTGTNGLKRLIHDPNLAAQMPDTITTINVTPASVNSVQSWNGAFYYGTPIDLTKGFRTKFFVNSTRGSLCFMIRNPDETRAFVPSLDPNFGIYGLTKTMAVMVLPYGNAGVLVGPGADGKLNGMPVNGGYGDIPLNPKGQGVLGTVIVQYVPRSHVLEMHFQDMFSGERRRVFQATNIDLEKQGILKDGKAMLGFVGVNPRVASGSNSYGPVALQSWEFGNDISMLGISSTSYSDRMVFSTPTPSSIWSPTDSSQNVLETVYSASGSGGIDKSSSSGGFGAGFVGDWDGKVGIRFKTTAKNGSMGIRYPMYLNLQFPPQASLFNGSTFTIKANFEPDALAGFTTKSPDYNFKASTWFGFNFDANAFVDLSVKKIKMDLPSIHANVGEFEFFDSDKALQIFGDGANTAYASGSVKDASYYSRDTFKSGGSTKGAKRGVNPLSYIQALVTRPNLSASGYVDVFDDARPTRLTAKAKSDFAGLRADFTSALLKPFNLDAVVNQDLSVNLGSGIKYAIGWHLADLYGDLLTTIDMQHAFQPMPFLVLQMDDLNPSTGAVLKTRYVKMALDPNGKVVETSPITLGLNPLRVTPKVYLSNPWNNSTASSGDPTLPDLRTPFNTFSTVEHLNLDGRVEFKPFEMYAEGTGIPSLNVDPKIFTLFEQSGSLTTKQSGDFEVPSFTPAIGKPYYFYPVEASAPVIDSATPSSIISPADSNAVTYVQLMTKFASAGVKVSFDGQLLGGEVILKDDLIHFGIPNTLLQDRAVHQIAIVTHPGASYQRVSNTVTLEVSAPIPTISSITPPQVILNEKPIAFGVPVMKIDSDGKEYLELTVKGSGFWSEVRNADHTIRTPQSVVTFNGTELPTTFVSPTILKASITRTLITDTGINKIAVRNIGAGGGESALVSFSVMNPAPTLSSASATLIGAKTQTDLVVKGRNFVKGAVIQLTQQGVAKAKPIALPTTFATAADVTATIGMGQLVNGSYILQVVNPGIGGGYSTEHLILTVDSFAPSTTLSITGTPAGANTYKGTVTLKLSATDSGPAGLDKTYIEVLRNGTSGGTPAEFSGAVTLSEPGDYTIRYYSVDKVQNEESAHVVKVIVLAP